MQITMGIIIIVLVGLVIFTFTQPKTNLTINPVKTVTVSAPTIVEPSPTSASITTAEYIKVFVTECIAKLGKSSTTKCTCAANTMLTKYSVADLTKFFIQYHSTGKVPAETKSAIDSCSTK